MIHGSRWCALFLPGTARSGVGQNSLRAFPPLHRRNLAFELRCVELRPGSHQFPTLIE